MTELTKEELALVRAGLDADEATARRVKGSWREDGNTGVIITSDGTHAEECGAGHWDGVAEHIVRHDPARVLRDVEVWRQLLTDYEKEVWVMEQGHRTGWTEGGQAVRATVLRGLALSYTGLDETT